MLSDENHVAQLQLYTCWIIFADIPMVTNCCFHKFINLWLMARLWLVHKYVWSPTCKSYTILRAWLVGNAMQLIFCYFFLIWNRFIIVTQNNGVYLHVHEVCTRFCCLSWWRHQMETISALLALYEGIHRSPVNSSHKGQWRGALIYSLICAWTNDRANHRDAMILDVIALIMTSL